MASYEVQRVTTTTKTVKKQQLNAVAVDLDSPWDGYNTTNTLSSNYEFNPGTIEKKQQPQFDTISLSQKLHHTRAARVRQALFPDTDTEVSQYSAGELRKMFLDGKELNNEFGTMSLQGMTVFEDTTAVQKLAEPAQILKTAVINLINYQEDADVALYAAGELRKLLLERDLITVQRAVTLIHLLSKKQACRLAFATQADLIEALVKLLQENQDAEVQRHCIASLCHISKSEQGSLLIFQCILRLIPELVRLLSSRDERVMFFSITCLHNILLVIEEAKSEVRQCGGIIKMVELLRQQTFGSHDNHLKFLALVVDCLQIICFSNQESKLLVLNAGGPQDLVQILKSNSYEKLLFVTARLLKVLSVCPSNKPAIIDCGGMNALGDHILNPSARLVINALWTLRNLSDQAFLQRDLDRLLVSLIQLLNSQDADYITCAAGILCNLTCQNPHNKEIVTRNNGAVALTQTLCAAQDREEISEPVVCALRHLTHDHASASQAAEAVLFHYGLPVLLKLLNPAEQNSRRPLVKASLGLARNLALFEECRGPLIELGLVSAAAEAVQLVSIPVSPGGSDRSSNCVDGVRSEEVIEMGLACLQALCKDQYGRQEVVSYHPPLVPLLVQALYSEIEYIQRNVTGLLTELTVDPRAAVAVESEGASARLTQLLHSRNDAVATYAAAILYHLAEDKPADYRTKLQDELTKSLTRQDLPLTPTGQVNSHGMNTWSPQARQFDASSLDAARPYQYENHHANGNVHPPGYNTYNGRLN